MNKKTFKEKLFLILAGGFTGICNGLFGGGGGMITVPFLTMLCGYEPKKAHATAIAVILPVSVISAVIYTVKGYFELKLSLGVGIGVILGGVLGALLLKKFSNSVIEKVFAGIMVVAGIKLLFF
ncbi:MAG: sulfite exporter TauE/SafE family protein [Clostridia bacterium]|nr:sulfite exporter TauE/SafE family protein [Clostridia bacterium]